MDYTSIMAMITALTTTSSVHPYLKAAAAAETLERLSGIDLAEVLVTENNVDVPIVTIDSEKASQIDAVFSSYTFLDAYNRCLFTVEETITVQELLSTINSALFSENNPTDFFDEEAGDGIFGFADVEEYAVDRITSMMKVCMPVRDLIQQKKNLTESEFLMRIGL